MRENESRRSLKTTLPSDGHERSLAREEHGPGVSNLMLPLQKPPYWLDSKYVGRHALKKTRQLVETKAKPDKKDVDTKKGRESLHIAHTVYAMSTDFLRESRVAARKRFFQDLGFALRPWEASRGIPEEFGQPNLTFKYPEHPFNFRDHVSSAVTSEAPDANVLNLQALQEMMSSRLELDVLVDYHVIVGDGMLKNGIQKRGFKPAERKRMYRTINLARVAVNFFVALTQGRGIKEFLGSHSGSLRAVYRTALLFRWFVRDIINGNRHIDMPSTLTGETEICLRQEKGKGVGHYHGNDRSNEDKLFEEEDESIQFCGELEEIGGAPKGRKRQLSEGQIDDEDLSEREHSEDESQQGSTMIRLKVRDFIPGYSKQKDILDAYILRMSPAQFNQLCTDSPRRTEMEYNAGNTLDRHDRLGVHAIAENDDDWEDRSDDGFDFEHLLHHEQERVNEI